MEHADIAFTTMIMIVFFRLVTSQVYTNGIPHIGDAPMHLSGDLRAASCFQICIAGVGRRGGHCG